MSRRRSVAALITIWDLRASSVESRWSRTAVTSTAKTAATRAATTPLAVPILVMRLRFTAQSVNGAQAAKVSCGSAAAAAAGAASSDGALTQAIGVIIRIFRSSHSDQFSM